MLNTIFGTKKQMTQVFDQTGKRWPATIVQSAQCAILQVKEANNDGYQAVQIGYGTDQRPNKPMQGHLKKASVDTGINQILEVKLPENQEITPGSFYSVTDVLEPGDVISVTGISKGKGFAGVVKRWGFAGGPKTHGQSDRHRAPGSIGAGTTPGRVLKGKKMAGRMGNDKVTIQGLTVLDVDAENHQIWLSGPVPGANNSLLIITKTGKIDNFPGLIKPSAEQNQNTEEDDSQTTNDSPTTDESQNQSKEDTKS